MFRSFEPSAPVHPLGNIVLSVGELSPAIRHESVGAVAGLVGARVTEIPGGGHAVHLDSVPEFAQLIRAQVVAASAAARNLDSARANDIRKGN
jgi:hypothetical protein